MHFGRDCIRPSAKDNKDSPTGAPKGGGWNNKGGGHNQWGGKGSKRGGKGKPGKGTAYSLDSMDLMGRWGGQGNGRGDQSQNGGGNPWEATQGGRVDNGAERESITVIGMLTRGVFCLSYNVVTTLVRLSMRKRRW